MPLKKIGDRYRNRRMKVSPKQNSDPEQPEPESEPEPEEPKTKNCIGKLCERMTLKKRVAPRDNTRVGGKTKRRKRKRRRKRKTRRYRKR